MNEGVLLSRYTTLGTGGPARWFSMPETVDELVSRLAWADVLRLEGDMAAQLAAPFGFAGASASATLLYVGADATSWLEASCSSTMPLV